MEDKNKQQEIKSPAIYKSNISNNYFATMFTSKAVSLAQIKKHYPTMTSVFEAGAVMYARYISKNECKRIPVFEIDSKYYHCTEDCQEDLILFKWLSNSSGAYARPVSSFDNI